MRFQKYLSAVWKDLTKLLRSWFIMYNFTTSANRPDVVWQEQIEASCEKKILFITKSGIQKNNIKYTVYTNDDQRVKKG